MSRGEAGSLSHPSGAAIEVPAGAIRKDAIITITEVQPPVSTLNVGKVKDFSAGDALLFQPVTLHIPYELEPEEEDAAVLAVHWNEELEIWEAVPGTVDEANLLDGSGYYLPTNWPGGAGNTPGRGAT